MTAVQKNIAMVMVSLSLACAAAQNTAATMTVQNIAVSSPALGGYAGQVSVADGTVDASKRLNRVLTNDPGLWRPGRHKP